jgi:hypothetical protein
MIPLRIQNYNLWSFAPGFLFGKLAIASNDTNAYVVAKFTDSIVKFIFSGNN